MPNNYARELSPQASITIKGDGTAAGTDITMWDNELYVKAISWHVRATEIPTVAIELMPISMKLGMSGFIKKRTLWERAMVLWHYLRTGRMIL